MEGNAVVSENVVSPKILIVGPAWVGDMVMAQSLFKAIKEQNKLAIIDVLAPGWTNPLLLRMPEVRKNILMPIGHGVLALGTRYALAKELRQEKYDQAIVLPNSWKSALIPWLAKIPKRTGWMREMRFGLLNDARVLNKKQLPLMVQRLVALAHKKGKEPPFITPSPELKIDQTRLQATLAKFNISSSDKTPILVLCPGAEFGASKRWPEHHYAALANEMIKKDWRIWLMGSKNDMPVATKIEEALIEKDRCFNFTGKTDLGEAIDLMSLANRVVSNDSGLMHIAASLNIPLVAVYGSTDPSFTPPLNARAKTVRLSLPCSPCFKRECPLKHHQCMENLSTGRVLDALHALTAGQQG